MEKLEAPSNRPSEIEVCRQEPWRSPIPQFREPIAAPPMQFVGAWMEIRSTQAPPQATPRPPPTRPAIPDVASERAHPRMAGALLEASEKRCASRSHTPPFPTGDPGRSSRLI